MNSIRTLAALATAAALTPGALAIGASAAPTSYVITGARSIDGYRVGAGYADARRLFGGPLSSSQDSATCMARWATGVTIAWHRRLPYAKWEKACVRFDWARVAGNRWRTDRGLHVGSTEAQLRKLYAGATRKSSRGYTVWKLAAGSGVTLQAWAKSGRVAYFRLVSG